MSYDRDSLDRLASELRELGDNIDRRVDLTLARYVRLADAAREAADFLTETVAVLDIQARNARGRIAADIIESRKRRRGR